jgi:hypothetical protein
MTTPLVQITELIELGKKATQGNWRWSENGNIVTDKPNRGCDAEIAAVYTERDDDDAPANAEFIVALVQWFRSNAEALAGRGEPKFWITPADLLRADNEGDCVVASPATGDAPAGSVFLYTTPSRAGGGEVGERFVFNCRRCPVSVHGEWSPPDCPECGDPTEVDLTAKPFDPLYLCEIHGDVFVRGCAHCTGDLDELVKRGPDAALNGAGARGD